MFCKPSKSVSGKRQMKKYLQIYAHTYLSWLILCTCEINYKCLFKVISNEIFGIGNYDICKLICSSEMNSYYNPIYEDCFLRDFQDEQVKESEISLRT